MELEIYSSTGKLKLSFEPKDSSTQTEEIQGGSVINLGFVLPIGVALEVNDYMDFDGSRYWVTERYLPTQKSTVEWEYTVKLYGMENLISRFLVLDMTDNANDPEFTLTASPREHVALIVASINAGFGTEDWKVGRVDGLKNIVIDYHGKYCDQALKAVAEAAGTEYWIDGTTVNLCRCEQGEAVTLGYHKGLTRITEDVADNAKVYTRLFPSGSTRNIDPARYGHTRLQLPDGQKYVDINTDRYGIIHHYETAAFADIYPRYTGTVSSVRSEERKNDDGSNYMVYYFKDDTLPFDPNEYEIAGLVKRVTFQEGSELAGLGNDDNGTHYLEVNFDSKTREFEIITIFSDNGQLPGGVLIPKVGDRYIPWNIRLPEEYYILAEQEFLSAAEAYNKERCVDVACYKAPTDYINIESRALELHVGQRVRLESDRFFPGKGYKESRITRITRRVNRPSQMDLEISDALSKSAIDTISDNIESVRSYARSIAGNVSLPDIIRTGDGTKPTDNNLLSALRSYQDLLRKDKSDRTPYLLGSDRGFEAGRYESGVSGGILGVDENGDSFAEVKRLFVRGKAYFEALTIIEAGAIAGKQYITPGGAVKCTHVEEHTSDGDGIPDGIWRCYFLSQQDGEKTETRIVAGDQAISEMFNAREGTDNKVSNHRWWRLVTGVSNDALEDSSGNRYGYIDVSKDDCETGSDSPAAGDVIAQFGNRTDGERQSAMVFSTVEADSPSLRMLEGIDSYTLSGKTTVGIWRDATSGNVCFRLGPPGSSQYLEYTQAEGLRVAGSISTLSTVGDKTLEEIAGDAESGSWKVRIVAEGGTAIFNGEGSRRLTARVFRRDEDVTDAFGASRFSWERRSSDSTDDLIWNKLHRGHGPVLTVDRDDVDRSAVFECKVDIGQ